MGVIEAADIGAIFSVFCGGVGFAVHALVQEGTAIQKITRGGLRLSLVAGCAAFIVRVRSPFRRHANQGVVGMEQDAQTKAMRWGEATQWSLPSGKCWM